MINLHIPISSRDITRRKLTDRPAPGLRIYKAAPEFATLQVCRLNEVTALPLNVDQLRALRSSIELMLLEDFQVSP